MKRIILSVIILAVVAFGIYSSNFATAGGATVSGKISFGGEVPMLPPLKMTPECSAKHGGKEVKPDVLVMGAGNTLANALIKIKSGLPAGATYPAPTEPTVIDQLGCMYIPHVIGTMKGQTVKIKNSDGTLHNVHGLPTVNTEFNMAMPAFKKETDKVFDKTEDPFKIKCDVHPWMSGYLTVLDNPYFAVTKEDGSFTISGLPAGTYELEVWHEKLGTQMASITVADGETKTQDFVLAKPASVGMLEGIRVIR